MRTGLRSRRKWLLAAAAVVLLTGCTGSKGGDAPAKPAISSLTAKAVNAQEIDLTWSASGPGIHGYRISRNGSYVNVVESTSYDDRQLEPETEYTYTVSIQDANGKFLPGKTVSATTTPAPTLAQARLDGSFTMRMVYTSENYTNRKVGDHYREAWVFTPKCDTGACGVGLKTGRRGEHKAHLTKKGAQYTGKGSDTLSSCQGVRGTESYTVDIHVTKARYVGDVWTATAVAGTVSYYAPPYNGCASGRSKVATKGASFSA
jgi:hypothetical protein